MQHDYQAPQKSSSSTMLKVVGIIALIFTAVSILSCVGCFGWLVSVDEESGTMGPHEMPAQVQQHMEQEQVLGAGEELLLYFDPTLSNDHSEYYVISNERALHHTPTGTMSLSLGEVAQVDSHEGTLCWIYQITTATGKSITFEMPYFNGINRFGRTLSSALVAADNPIVFHIPDQE